MLLYFIVFSHVWLRRAAFLAAQGLFWAAQGLDLAAQGLYLATQGLRLALQGPHSAIQGVYFGAQGLYLAAQWLYLADVQQIRRLAAWLGGPRPRQPAPERPTRCFWALLAT